VGQFNSVRRRSDLVPPRLRASILQTSWREGNSLPQTLFTYLLTHADGIRALRQRVGIKSYVQETRDPILRKRQEAAAAAAAAAATAATAEGTSTETAISASSSGS
jgi:hypothetical protein